MPIPHSEESQIRWAHGKRHKPSGNDDAIPQAMAWQARRSTSPIRVFNNPDGRAMTCCKLIERLKSSRNLEAEKTDNAVFSKQDANKAFPNGIKPTSLLSSNLSKVSKWNSDDPYEIGMDIKRPNSALHSGEFRQQDDQHDPSSTPEQTSQFTFPTSSLRSVREDFFLPDFIDGLDFTPRLESQPRLDPPRSSFHLLAPTTPLIHTTLSPELDRPRSPTFGAKRHCFSSHPSSKSYSIGCSPTASRRIDRNSPCQAHQPRRSIPGSQTPLLRPRGSSICSNYSPLQHAPMVGSYEESILRGRMATTPSQPLEFIAQVGVLGRGSCRPSLRCPAHVTTTFPAVFYSYISKDCISDNSPSPYVGHVNLESSFPSYAGKAPPGGCYRIPQHGQIQIIIKNPNKTAVKLFLVPYNLSDMKSGQKTFIRQRTYSAGPMHDWPVSNREDRDTDMADPDGLPCKHLTERRVPRYLVHLHICCTAKGRFFLYRSIRLVFANHMPDGKGSLRTEVQLPDPKYAPYRPGSMVPGSQTGSPSAPLPLLHAMLVENKAAGRRSIPFLFNSSVYNLDGADGLTAKSFPSDLH